MNKVDYSIVVPVYYNEGSLEYTEQKVRSQVFEKVPGKRGELVFVDDGSGDGSYEELRRIKRAHPDDVRVFKLSRNFGQFNADWCGMEHTDGPVVVISADGQDPAELIPEMLRLHFEEGKEIVLATRESREETWWRRWTSSVFHYLLRTLGNSDMPKGGFDFFLLGKKAKDALLEHWQPNIFAQVRILNLGFPRQFIPYHREDRKAGVSKWTFWKKFKLLIDGLLGHSYVPIRAMSVLGILFSGLSFLLGIHFFIMYFINPNVIRGWTPIMLLILFIGGIQMMMIGVLGEYLWRVLDQARKDPPCIVEEEMTV